MRNLILIVLAGLSLWFSSGPAHALGFGRSTNATQLGQALNFAATVTLAADETLPRECVAADVYSGDNKLQPGQVRVTLEPGGNADQRSVRVTSFALIDEPVVTVDVTVGCRSKVSRKFIAFVDPPGSNPPQADPSELPPQRVESQVAPLLAIVQASAEKPAPAASTERRSERKLAAADAPASASTRHGSARRHLASASHRRTAVVAAKAGARLELEASPAIAAHASDSAAAAAASALQVADAASAGLARAETQANQDRQRIERLEQSLAGLRNESKTTLAKLSGLQTQVRDVESGKGPNLILYGLIALCALLTLAVAWLWRRQSTTQRSAQWWTPPDAVPAAAADTAVAVEVMPAPAVVDEPARAEFGAPHTIPVDPRHEAAAIPPAISHSGPETMPGEPRDLSVDELIDLEQQVDFFVVLGQDEAAIDLLTSHARSGGSSGPLPYLKLLEIHRRRGDEDAYARIRERFNRRFGAHVPAWGSDLHAGQSLEDHGELMRRLEQLWSAPQLAMATLEESLFRRDAANATTFDLPAYEQLLFLYAIARDRLEFEFESGGGVVDLLLPLGVDAVAPAAASHSTQPLDLDVSIPAARPPLRAAPALNVEEHASSSAFLEFTELPGKTGPLAAR